MQVKRAQSIFYPLLKPISFFYAQAMKARRAMFKSGFRKQRVQSVPTVSVGNISWGGTGKTPVVEYLTAWALRKTIKPVILTRGYGGKPPYLPCLVNSAHKASEVGDEPLMLSNSLPLAAVVVDPVRTRAIKYTEEKFQPDIYFLDDGFQHLNVERHLDLVLLTAHDLHKGFGEVMPSGTWREPASALKDADAFIIKTNRDSWDELCESFMTKMEAYKKPFFAFTLLPMGLIPSEGEYTLYPAEILKESPYAIVVGIGNPKQAKDSIIRFMGREPAYVKYFPDHHEFTLREAFALMELEMPIVCTHKDVVKLKNFHVKNLWYLKTQLSFSNSFGTKKSFNDWLEGWWEKQSGALPSSDKSHLEFVENTFYNGDRFAWGEELLVPVMPEVYFLPHGWGPKEEEKKGPDKIFKVINASELEPKQTKTKPEAEKEDDTRYAYTLADNIREHEAQQKTLKKINKRVEDVGGNDE